MVTMFLMYRGRLLRVKGKVSIYKVKGYKGYPYLNEILVLRRLFSHFGKHSHFKFISNLVNKHGVFYKFIYVNLYSFPRKTTFLALV